MIAATSSPSPTTVRKTYFKSRVELREQRRRSARPYAPALRAELAQAPLLFRERVQKLLRGLGDLGQERQRQHPERLDEAVEHLVQPLRIASSLARSHGRVSST